MLATMSPQMAEALEKIGVVGIAGTTVTATGEDGKARTLKAGDEVFLNDRVVSDAGGEAQLIFLDRSTLTLKANTDLTLDTYVYDPKAASGTMAVSSVKGAFRFVGGALSKKQPVTIKTPVATIGIRGGIADTNVQPGTGASDAVFVYGEELSMTNQSGETSTTTQIGTGLMLDAPGGSPVPMPPELVNQRMQAFGTPSPDADAGNNSGAEGGASEGGGSGGADAGGSSEGDSTAGSGNAGGSSGAAGGGGNPVGQEPNFAAADGVAGSGAVPGGMEGSFGEIVNAIAAQTGQEAANAKIVTAVQTGDESVLPGITQILETQGVLPEGSAPPPPAGGENGEPAPLPPIAGGEGDGSNPPPLPLPPVADTGISGGGGGGSTTSYVPKLRGRYFHFDVTPTMVATGEIESNPARTNVGFTEVERRNSPVFTPDLAGIRGGQIVQNSAAATDYSTAGSATLHIDANGDGTNETSVSGGVFYATPDNSFRRYYFPSAEKISFFLGESIFDDATIYDASRMLEARVRSFNDAITDGYDGVTFYAFLPDMAIYPDSNASIGLLDYRVIAPYSATNATFITNQTNVLNTLGYTSAFADDHLRTGPGMMVDWQQKRFLTQNVEFVAATSMRPFAFAAAGVVNDNGPNFLDGAGMMFESERNTTVAGNNTTRASEGTLNVGRELYGTRTGGIEAFVTKINAVTDTRSYAASTLSTGTGSSYVQITGLSGATSEYRVGDKITLSGVSGDINGIPVAQLNGREFVITSVGPTSVEFNVGAGNTATSSGTATHTAFNATIRQLGAQAAVVDNSHGISATDFVHGRTGTQMRGFASGIVKKEGAVEFIRYGSTAEKDASGKLTGVVIQPNDTTGELQANITTYRDGNSTINPNDKASGTFGGVNSAYLHDKHYAAEQQSGTMGADSATVTTGFITTATNDRSVSTYTCTNCKYTQWGVWASKVTTPSGAQVVEMMPYVAGHVTQNFDQSKADAINAATGNIGSVNYTGGSYGVFHKNGDYTQNAHGNLNATINLANREVTSLNMNFGSVLGSNLTMNTTANVPISATGDAVFSTTAVNVDWPSVGGTTNGVINGALFGPNAEEIGGNFSVQHNEGNTLTGGGVFQGAR